VGRYPDDCVGVFGSRFCLGRRNLQRHRDGDLNSPVTFTAAASSSGVCTVTSGGAVSFTGGGICSSIATRWVASTETVLRTSLPNRCSRTFAVAEIPQTVYFPPRRRDDKCDQRNLRRHRDRKSGLTPAITVDASSSSVCTISGATVTFNKGGVCALDANQAGNTSYAEATQVQQAFAVVKNATNNCVHFECPNINWWAALRTLRLPQHHRALLSPSPLMPRRRASVL